MNQPAAYIPLIDFEIDIYSYDAKQTLTFQVSAQNAFSAIQRIISAILEKNEAASFSNMSLHIKRKRPY